MSNDRTRVKQLIAELEDSVREVVEIEYFDGFKVTGLVTLNAQKMWCITTSLGDHGISLGDVAHIWK